MNIWIELLTVVVEVFYPWYFYSGILEAPPRSKWVQIATGLAYFAALSVLSLFVTISLIRVLSIICLTYIAGRIYFDVRWIDLVYPTVLFFLFAVISDLLCAALLSLGGIPADVIMGAGTGRLIYNALSKLLHLMCLYIVVNVTKYRYDSSVVVKALPLLLFQALSIYIYYHDFTSVISGDSISFGSFEILSLLYMNLIVCAYFEILNRYHEKQKETEMEIQQLEISRNHYLDLVQRQEETRSLWHDIKKYMTLMEALVSSENKEEARRCFDALSSTFENTANIVDTGNTLIDSILTHEMKKAAEAGVTIKPEIWVSSELAFPIADLFIIIGNTADNAIEACGRLEDEDDRVVSLSLRQKNHFLLYEITNPYSGIKARKPGKIHGCGLKNVRACVDRCGGDMSISTDGGVFTVSIQLNLEE